MDLSTQYLGLELPHPFIVGASPIADHLDRVRQAEDAGAAAIVMRSLFEEQILNESLATHEAMDTHAESFGEALSYFPQPEEFVMGPQEYLEQLRRVKETVGVPVIGSLNGVTQGGWLKYASLIEQAGADALELNLYDVAMDIEQTAETLEHSKIEMVEEVKKSIQIPVSVKLSRFYTSLVNFAERLRVAGADGLVLFNRFFQPDIDTEELQYVSRLKLSTSEELPLRLRWLAILSAKVPTSYAVSGGVHTAQDAIRSIMCGADAVQLVSSLLRLGPGYLRDISETMKLWMEEKEYESLSQMKGSMNLYRCPNPRLLYRANYIQLLQTWDG